MIFGYLQQLPIPRWEKHEIAGRQKKKRLEEVARITFSREFIRDLTARGAIFAPSALPDEFESHSWDNCLSFLFWIVTIDKIVKVC
jgi:hypothetical protein